MAPGSPRPRCAHRHLHRASGLCWSAMGLGAMPGRPASCFSLSGLEPLSTKEENTKAFRSSLRGKPTFPALPPTQRYSSPHAVEKASVPPFQDQSAAGGLEVVPASTWASVRPPEHGVQHCLCRYLCISRSVRVCAFWGGGLIRLPKTSLTPKGFWTRAKGLRVFQGKQRLCSPGHG